MQRKKAMTYGVSFSTQANSYSSKYGDCNDNSRNNKYGRGYQKSYTNVFFRSRKEETFKETVEIRDWLQKELYVPTTKVSLKTLHQTFYGGQFACHAKEWEKLTSDHNILQMVKSGIMKFKDKTSLQHLANNPQFATQEELLSCKALEEMFEKETMKETVHEEELSPQFLLQQI